MIIFIVIGVFLEKEELTIISKIFFIFGVLGYVATILYFYGAITLFVSIQLVGFKAGLFQILKRLRGSLLIQLFGTGLLAVLAIFGGFLLFIIPGIIFLVNYIFALPVVILENKTYVKAMRRSHDLVRGNWWRVFGVVVLCIILYYIGYLISNFLLHFLFTTFGIHWQVASIIASLIAQFLFVPFLYSYPVFLYYDLRIRKEAFNIEDIREVV